MFRITVAAVIRSPSTPKPLFLCFPRGKRRIEHESFLIGV
jgi:hypothetical protein